MSPAGWYRIDIPQNAGIAGMVMLQRIQGFLPSLVQSSRVPDIAMFNLRDGIDEDTWFFPPGTEAILRPLLAAMEPTPCEQPNLDELTCVFHYSPTNLDPWDTHFGRQPVHPWD